MGLSSCLLRNSSSMILQSNSMVILVLMVLEKALIGVGRGGAGGANAPPLFLMGGHRPPTFLELYINCRIVAPNCCARPVA